MALIVVPPTCQRKLSVWIRSPSSLPWTIIETRPSTNVQILPRIEKRPRQTSRSMACIARFYHRFHRPARGEFAKLLDC
jgi:hypothetical protein